MKGAKKTAVELAFSIMNMRVTSRDNELHLLGF